ncbi:alpha/beta hydrolase [Agarivorans sp. TSD2052]|uniref:alpha/beta fold hydrolase n=1 Tax=Agarivorans sp. TSD2052 TaxID=2937286 RepID=UPI00200E7E31|nr:alpha/beta hydrolase [Agarivorans sp. TSD2052]UPW17709.1 alpha/beta hydrolase [Agarivorans sp. TSD2052]
MNSSLQLSRWTAALVLVLSITGCSALSVKEQLDNKQLTKAHFTQSEIQLSEGGQLRYWIGGKGQPLVMLHGFGGTATTTWLPMMLALSQHYQVIAPDLAWFGDSVSHGPANITTQRAAVNQLLSQLRVEHYHLVGISYGGLVAYDMMANQQNIQKAVILSSPGTFISDQDLAELSQRFSVEQPADIFVPENRLQMRRLFEGVFTRFPPLPHAIDEQIYQRYFAPWQPQKRQLIDSLPSYRDTLSQQVKPEDMPPVLLVWGENDQVFTLEQGKQLSRYLHAPMVIIPDAPHNISNEYPDTVSQAIELFIQ